jgi:transposase-like protein
LTPCIRSRLSLREISDELAQRGFVTANDTPYQATSVKGMLRA